MEDPVRHRTLVFGGCGGPACDRDPAPLANDLWAYDHRAASWSRFHAAGLPPAPRMGAHAFYDPVRDRMLLFGGRRFSSDPTPMLDGWTLTLSQDAGLEPDRGHR
jgi:hypothetical protein